MAYKWLICITVIVIVEHIAAKSPRPPIRHEAINQATTRHQQTRPLAKSKAKFSKNLEGRRRLGQEYVEQYQDMMKASQESFEDFDKGLRRLIGEDDLGLMAEAGGIDGRRGRSGGRLSEQSEQSAVGRRRARSQAIRLEKLNAQSVISHKRHSRTTFTHKY